MAFTLRTVLAASLAAAALTAPGTAPVASAAADRPLKYVALGDSFAASPQVPPPDVSNLLCLRSLANYPHVTARMLGAGLNDASCSAASLDDLRTSQHPGTDAQYDALSSDTDIVSITIGGVDVGMVELALDCMNPDPEPAGESCAARNTQGGRDRMKAAIDAWTPRFATALEEVHRRSPRARVYVVGYGNVIRPGGCFPAQPLWDKDATYLQGTFSHLDHRLRQTARKHGAAFVDTYTPGLGHDACAPPAERHTEGWVRASAALPLHPNAQGARAIATALASAVRRTSPPR
ncbi:SGNH/GDSL hydrolase family protein [Streptomyces sp. WAC05374]|uniref:SGNH/GDSL hydrolase family protein n=1 Tax=Streptomyces sp. WAC05374 TaxID=2487420 RepID=UPI000F89183C|nr:SGNH/GDSL hydrolase family protein [Streptomyces sp. WAC05374]RST05564.1 SGNH/GDSL hydrolase family protein [Streptomyces sp. WAC05374]TDF54586.1 SGNH/GDSL hydrolase family protein [Streptomyces sp. WAC05374]TDF56221.1 SGNH/GDSL hydrolase family protein [Streptomyces sp. WAC05374]